MRSEDLISVGDLKKHYHFQSPLNAEKNTNLTYICCVPLLHQASRGAIVRDERQLCVEIWDGLSSNLLSYLFWHFHELRTDYAATKNKQIRPAAFKQFLGMGTVVTVGPWTTTLRKQIAT